MKKAILLSALFIAAAQIIFAQKPAAKRNLLPADVYQIKLVNDPQVSPEGNWIAYVLTSVDSAQNKRKSSLWMVNYNSKETVQLTHRNENETKPRWSKDGKYLAFFSSRVGPDEKVKGNQLWLLDRRGGEARQLTKLKGELSDYAWSPDGKQMVLVIRDLKKSDTSKLKEPDPVVIDRFHFKQDIEGYLDRTPSHLYLFNIITNKLDTLTKGTYSESNPAWSPDGSTIAFESNRTADPDKNENSDIWLIDAKPNAQIKQLTTWKGSDKNPVWSPDGKRIAYLRSTADQNYLMYDQAVLAVISKTGGQPELLTAKLDRPVDNPQWAKDGKSIAALVTDDRQRYLAKIEISNKKITTLAGGNRSFYDLEAYPNGGWITLMSEPQLPGEIYAIENSKTIRLTHHHDAFFSRLNLASVQGFTSVSKDGTKVSSLLFLPPGKENAKNLPLILFIHGGPVAQDEYNFDLSRQMLAARGYAVIAVNYRGSNGRGLAYTKAIFADWGHKEVMDLLGAVDYVVQKGIADPNRLGIGGWSYGGILTDYTIASDTRFKAAASGAGSAMQLSLYGVDQYILQWTYEIGEPWKNLDKYIQLSYPFLHADKIKTPTLFMAGEKDYNVPAVGSEQMYQALKTLNIPAQLIIYPGQFHGISVPSYQVDRFKRYWDWFDLYLKNPNQTVGK